MYLSILVHQSHSLVGLVFGRLLVRDVLLFGREVLVEVLVVVEVGVIVVEVLVVVGVVGEVGSRSLGLTMSLYVTSEYCAPLTLIKSKGFIEF